MENSPLSAEEDHCHGGACCGTPAPAVDRPVGASESEPQTFRIATMDCSAEEAEIRRALEPLPGVRGLNFQLGARTLAIDADIDALPVALEAIRRAGFDPRPLQSTEGTNGFPLALGASAEEPTGILSRQGVRLALALAFAATAEAVSYFAPHGIVWALGGMALALVAIGLAGVETYHKGLSALRHGRLNINALMSVAVTGAFVLGQWPEAAMVMALYAVAELIEAGAVDRARNSIKGLLALAPSTVELQQADGRWASAPTSSVALDATIRIKPGERVALDGVVTVGASAVNQASVTGESIPVDKTPGDAVFAGTINQTGELEVRVTSTAGDSTLARIIHAVEQAQGSRAPTQRFVDQFAAIYTPAVFAIAVAVAALLPALTDATWLQAAYKALVLLVIACPCALVISTPVTVVSGLSAAARKGILIKGGVYLEQARLLKAIALDKTGTITEGKPKLVASELLGASDETTLRLGASLAARSDHPVSQAIATGVSGDRAEVNGFEALPGRGVQGVIDGVPLLLANRRAIQGRCLITSELNAKLAEHEAAGRTVTLLANDRQVLALYAVADTPKASSVEAIQILLALGVRPIMLTGDNASTARAIASQVGLADVQGDLLPQDKQRAVGDMQRSFGKTAMVGDGINDAPSLAQADIGFAMGHAGTDIAVEAADVVIMNDDLRRVAATIELSRKTHQVLWQNIVIALGIKALFLVLAIFGNATMWMAVFADMGASLLVVANGLRLLRS